MLTPYTYLLINFFVFIVCFLFSFDSRIKFYLEFRSFIRSAALVAIPFILWDVSFTRMGVWWFNSDYTLGIAIAGLPIEEWLFFICIPFACVFTYFCLGKFFDLSWANGFNNIIVFVSCIVCIVVILLHFDKTYTMVTALALTITMIYLHFIAKESWIGQASFVYMILMLGFFPVNGILTGTGLESPVVNYNEKEFLNIRMLTIPIEDAVYGYTLFLLNVYFFKIFQSRAAIKNRAYSTKGIIALFTIFISSCASIPETAKPVHPFESEKYLGTWYEIARFDYVFERNLNNVTARYRMKDEETIEVFNSGFDYKKNKWQSATGKAKFRGDKNTAALKVSFFGPFYSGYNVIAIDQNYQYALVAGKSLEYLWILSRTKTIPEEVKQDYLNKAQMVGYDISKLIWVEHNQNKPDR